VIFRAIRTSPPQASFLLFGNVLAVQATRVVALAIVVRATFVARAVLSVAVPSLASFFLDPAGTTSVALLTTAAPI